MRRAGMPAHGRAAALLLAARDGAIRRVRGANTAALLALAALVAVPAAPSGAQEPARSVVRAAQRAQGWIGVTVEWALQEGLWRTGSAPTPAIVIADVFAGSPAARAGLQRGDTILRINQQPATFEAIERLQSTLRAGSTVRFDYRRGGRTRTAQVTAAGRPADAELETLPPQVRVRIENAQALLMQHLDSAARQAMFADADGGPRVFMLRNFGDSFRVVVGSRGDPLQGDAFDRTWAVAVGPTPAPFGGVVARRQPQVEIQIRRPTSSSRGTATLAAELTAPEQAAEASRIVAALEEHRRPLAPYILGQDVIAGAKLTPVNAGLSEYFGVSRGLLVVEVVDDGTPAAEAGLVSGDVIVSAGRRNVATVEELRSVFTSAGAAEAIPLTIVRKGQRLQVQVPR